LWLIATSPGFSQQNLITLEFSPPSLQWQAEQSATDELTFAGVAVLLTLVALARRTFPHTVPCVSTPMTALRYE
jgi:hypothetical protein